jgi:2-(1,2-epoxy-1,2-dihydrophenyl)acetyl-CoA isomerase
MNTIQVDRHNGVVEVTLDRPAKKNAMNGEMIDELRVAFAEIAESTPDDRVVVITGSGGAFCSGADLTGRTPGVPPLVGMRNVGQACLALRSLPQPTIAKVVGPALGAGLNLALACDFVVASDTARLCEIFVKRGLTVDFGGSWLLPRLVGERKAKELVFFGESVDAAAAVEMGLINRALPVEEIDAFVATWASQLASGPSLALAACKRLLDQSYAVSLAEAVEAEARSQVASFGSADAVEALAAFMEKRPPVFRGL